MVPKEDRITTTVPGESKPTVVVPREDRITTTVPGESKHTYCSGTKKIELPQR